MVYNISKDNPLVGQIVAELRDVEIQQDRPKFRRNLERLGQIFACEIARHLPSKSIEVVSSLGVAECSVLAEQPILGTILRAGLPLHTGLLHFFDHADCAFMTAYRKHSKSGKFTIKLDYISCPDLSNRILILADPMLATGASLTLALEELIQYGQPKVIHLVTAIASTVGIEEVRRHYPNVSIWTAAIDEELTARGLIVPGLGDAGDLAFGEKIQS